MKAEFRWPTVVDPSDRLVIETRSWFQRVFSEAFAARNTEWIAEVLDEKPFHILVLFHDFSGKPYPPEVHFSAMCTKQDVESKTVFLPWI